jgi:hypothetical protein
MTTPWGLQLSIDARGHDDTRVSTQRLVGTDQQQLLVRVGLVVVHCLDGAAAMSAGLAWATARVHAREWLPDAEEPELRARRATSRYGGAFPTGSVFYDGHQPWQVTPKEQVLVVTVGPLQVNVHDWIALDTHLRAWTEASAVAAKVFPGKAVPFGRLIDKARTNAFREIDAKLERDRNRRRASQAPQRTRE